MNGKIQKIPYQPDVALVLKTATQHFQHIRLSLSLLLRAPTQVKRRWTVLFSPASCSSFPALALIQMHAIPLLPAPTSPWGKKLLLLKGQDGHHGGACSAGSCPFVMAKGGPTLKP